MPVLRDILKPNAPTEVITPKPISVHELLTRRREPDVFVTEAEALSDKSPFAIASPPPSSTHHSSLINHHSSFVEASALDHFAELHRYGRKPHAEIITGLLDNFYTDGNQAHLDQAQTFLEHLRTL